MINVVKSLTVVSITHKENEKKLQNFFNRNFPMRVMVKAIGWEFGVVIIGIFYHCYH